MDHSVLIYYSKSLNLAARPEHSTPLTSLRRLAEGYWLKQASISPYAAAERYCFTDSDPEHLKGVKGLPGYLLCSLVFVVADFAAAMLLRETGRRIQSSYNKSLELLGLENMLQIAGNLHPGDTEALLYLWNPMTILTCVSSSVTPFENLIVILTLYGASGKLVPLAAFGWVMTTLLFLYPAVLIRPVILLLGYDSDTFPRKLFRQKLSHTDGDKVINKKEPISLSATLATPATFSWKPIIQLFLWVCAWSVYILIPCGLVVGKHGGLLDMFRRYFFTQVFDFFRDFFLLMVFHMNIVFTIHVGDSALYTGLLGLFISELAEMTFPFFLFWGYIGVNLLSPVMHNFWIWRGTGNVNFYFATAMAFACFQIILVVETVNSMLHHDRKLKKLLAKERLNSINDDNSARPSKT